MNKLRLTSRRLLALDVARAAAAKTSVTATSEWIMADIEMRQLQRPQIVVVTGTPVDGDDFSVVVVFTDAMAGMDCNFHLTQGLQRWAGSANKRHSGQLVVEDAYPVWTKADEFLANLPLRPKRIGESEGSRS